MAPGRYRRNRIGPQRRGFAGLPGRIDLRGLRLACPRLRLVPVWTSVILGRLLPGLEACLPAGLAASFAGSLGGLLDRLVLLYPLWQPRPSQAPPWRYPLAASAGGPRLPSLAELLLGRRFAAVGTLGERGLGRRLTVRGGPERLLGRRGGTYRAAEAVELSGRRCRGPCILRLLGRPSADLARVGRAIGNQKARRAAKPCRSRWYNAGAESPAAIRPARSSTDRAGSCDRRCRYRRKSGKGFCRPRDFARPHRGCRETADQKHHRR